MMWFVALAMLGGLGFVRTNQCDCPGDLVDIDSLTPKRVHDLKGVFITSDIPFNIDDVPVDSIKEKLAFGYMKSYDPTYEFHTFHYWEYNFDLGYGWDKCPSTKLGYGVTTDTVVLDPINRLISCTHGDKYFVGVSAVALAWLNVVIYDCTFRSTFQSVLITNGTSTYWLRQYKELYFDIYYGHGPYRVNGKPNRGAFMKKDKKENLLDGGCNGTHVDLISVASCIKPNIYLNTTYMTVTSDRNFLKYGENVTLTCDPGYEFNVGSFCSSLYGKSEVNIVCTGPNQWGNLYGVDVNGLGCRLKQECTTGFGYICSMCLETSIEECEKTCYLRRVTAGQSCVTEFKRDNSGNIVMKREVRSNESFINGCMESPQNLQIGELCVHYDQPFCV